MESCAAPSPAKGTSMMNGGDVHDDQGLHSRIARGEQLALENHGALREMRVELKHIVESIENLRRCTERLHKLISDHADAEEQEMSQVRAQLEQIQAARKLAVWLVSIVGMVAALALSAYGHFKP